MSQLGTAFNNIYAKSHRLSSAVFLVSNSIFDDDQLKTKIKKLSLDMVSYSVCLRDADYSQARKVISDIEKGALALMSLLDIAAASGLISQMNGSVIREEFKSFISELVAYKEVFDQGGNSSVKGLFAKEIYPVVEEPRVSLSAGRAYEEEMISPAKNEKRGHFEKGNNGRHGGLKRKDLRKNTILEYVRNHPNVSIKDIVPHISGCSEKTIQRELIALINEGKIRKTGERRWSKYTIF